MERFAEVMLPLLCLIAVILFYLYLFISQPGWFVRVVVWFYDLNQKLNKRGDK
ncbi:MAG: hypothetical protein MUF38_01510 [Anaerolineae bacterium]|jgi:hypothetical protein|nr:hypothetical protein [Anaerolineae bacterium]